MRRVAKLLKKDARSETGLFLLEGPQGLKEALERSKNLVVEVYATEDAVARHPEQFARAESQRVRVELVTEQVLKAMTDTTTPQGVVTVCNQVDVSLTAVLAEKPKLIALLANVRDPGNAGTILRAADAAGADAVFFSKGSVDLYNNKVVRSTTGSILHLPVVVDVDILEAIQEARETGMQIFAANGGGEQLPTIDRETLAKPTVWVFGNEAWGFEDSTLARVDRQVGLPIYGSAESLNVATAASVCLYESAFAQNA